MNEFNLEKTELGNAEFDYYITQDIRAYIRLRERGTTDKFMQLVFDFKNTPEQPENASKEHSVCEGSFLPYDSEGNYFL